MRWAMESLAAGTLTHGEIENVAKEGKCGVAVVAIGGEEPGDLGIHKGVDLDGGGSKHDGEEGFEEGGDAGGVEGGIPGRWGGVRREDAGGPEGGEHLGNLADAVAMRMEMATQKMRLSSG